MRKKKKASLLKNNIKYQRRKCKELKRDIKEIQSQEGSIEKGNTRKILSKKSNIKKKYQKNYEPKREYEKNSYAINPEPKREHEKKERKSVKKSLNQKKSIAKRCIKRTKTV